MIPEDHRDNVISAASVFVQTITAAYGADAGIALWERISEVIDPEIRASVFMEMLAGAHTGGWRIKIPIQSFSGGRGLDRRVEFTRFVKDVDIRNLSLRGAVDISDDVASGRETYILIRFSDRKYIIDQLRSVYGLDIRS